MLKKILTVLIVVVALFCVIGWLLPRHVVVMRSVVIDRPASRIYATVNSFASFAQWSPWQDLDPNMILDHRRPARWSRCKVNLEGE